MISLYIFPKNWSSLLQRSTACGEASWPFFVTWESSTGASGVSDKVPVLAATSGNGATVRTS